MMSKFSVKSSIRKTIHGTRYLFTHGHVYNEENPPANIDVLIHGHTHVNGITKTSSGMIIANPGSVSIPKGGTVPSYLIVSDHSIVVKDLANGSEIHRINF